MLAVRVPPSACSTSQSTTTWRSPSIVRSQAARNDRPMRRWISTVRPLCLPLAASRSTRSGDEPGQHRVLGGHPALARAAHPAGHVVVDARRAQHLGPPERDEARAVGHLGVVAFEGDRAQLVVGAAVGSHHRAAPSLSTSWLPGCRRLVGCSRRPRFGGVELGTEQAPAELAEQLRRRRSTGSDAVRAAP